MTWCALDVRATETIRPEIARWLVRRTGHAVLECADGSLVGAAASETAASVLGELREAFDGVSAAGRSLPEEDWTSRWREGLGPRRVGRLTISPSWAATPEDAGFLVVVDPETAFGTGEHGSTRSVLHLLDRWARSGQRVLDLGSGSGILAIAAVKLGASRAVGIDIDPEVETVAQDNAARNGSARQCAFLTGDAGSLAGLLGPADLVLSNILRLENEALLPVIRETLVRDGLALFGGMETSEAEPFRRVLAGEGFRIIDECVDEGWWSVAACPG